jgi:hypothetical protein
MWCCHLERSPDGLGRVEAKSKVEWFDRALQSNDDRRSISNVAQTEQQNLFDNALVIIYTSVCNCNPFLHTQHTHRNSRVNASRATACQVTRVSYRCNHCIGTEPAGIGAVPDLIDRTIVIGRIHGSNLSTSWRRIDLYVLCTTNRIKLWPSSL